METFSVGKGREFANTESPHWVQEQRDGIGPLAVLGKCTAFFTLLRKDIDLS